MGGIYGSAGPALIPARRNCSRTLQFMKQRANIALHDAIASHKKSHRGIPKQLVQRWFGAMLVKHDFLPPQFRHGNLPAGE
jgi:hypothetical protein